MPGGGLMSLVSYGAQNVILNGNPEFTFFYKVFKRHTHFSKENITIPLDGPNELFWDQPIKVRAKIPRNADLLANLQFVIDLPDIYSKFSGEGSAREDNFQYEFQWIRWLGCNIIKNVAFFVGGSKIQEFDADYMISKAIIDYPYDKYIKWQKLVGDVPELNRPSFGTWEGGLQVGATASGVANQYPTVYQNPFILESTSRPSIFGQRLYVPLPFWFAESPSKALPLVALQYHECEIQLTLRTIRELYNIRDISGYRVAPGFAVNAPSVSPANDPTNVLGGVVFTNNPIYIPNNDPKQEFRFFLTDPILSEPSLNNFYYGGHLEGTYIYLTDEERKVFATTPLSYLIQQQTTQTFDNIYARTILDLAITNPVTRMILIPRRSDQLEYRNAFGNFTNWAFYPQKPNDIDGLNTIFFWLNYTVPGTVPPRPPLPGEQYYHEYITARNYKDRLLFQSSGVTVPNGQKEIIQTIRVLLDGNEIQEEKPVTFFTRVTPYYGLEGGSQEEAEYLPVIEFSLNGPEDQPSGSVNASRVRNFQLEVNPFPLPINTQYVYNLKVITESYNFFVVEGGMGGLKFMV